MEYTDFLTRFRLVHPLIAEETTELRGLEGVMAWMLGRGVPLSAAEIVAQDEFSLDFIVPLQPGMLYVAFGITCLGAVTAVAVWDHRPTADELLHQRLADGWTPTATRLQAGEKILGHAACLEREAASGLERG